VIFSDPPLVPTTYNNPGGSGLNPNANYSTDVGPEVVAKVTADPGVGDFELYALGRAFRSRASFSNHTIIGTVISSASPAASTRRLPLSPGERAGALIPGPSGPIQTPS